jgi:hypothetical protein
VTTHLPTPLQIRELFSDLLDREVTLKPAPPVTPTPNLPASVAVYVDDLLRVTGVIACDLALSARAGAAIGLSPVNDAEAAIADRAIGEDLRDNLYEVLNIAASVFNVEGADHVRLYALHEAGAPLPQDVQARALTLGRREDVELDIAGYGAGRLSVVLA